MSRLEGPAVCFSLNPLRFDHTICIRLGLQGLDYTNGGLQSPPARMHGNERAMHSLLSQIQNAIILAKNKGYRYWFQALYLSLIYSKTYS